MNDKSLPFKETSIYYILRFLLIIAIIFIVFIFTHSACKRISGSNEQLLLITKEIENLSFLKNIEIKGQSVIHHFQDIKMTAFYSIPKAVDYKENDVVSYYINRLKNNAWNFKKKEKKYNLDLKKDQNTYTWTKRKYKLVLEVYDKAYVHGLDIYFDSIGYKDGDYIYSITIYWDL